MTASATLTPTPSSKSPWQRLGISPSKVVLFFVIAFFVITLVMPMVMVLRYSVSDSSGAFVGLSNFIEYFVSGNLIDSVKNTLFIGCMTTAIVIVFAFAYAYALNRTNMPFKRVLKVMAFLPILAPSLMPAISIIYLFGNQSAINKFMHQWFDGFDVLMGADIYGPIGIVMGLSLWCFPHAMMIINTALSNADQRFYEASRTLGASNFRTFWNVTIPAAKYGLISAALVVFTFSITDFGVPKVVGGQFNVLATDIYKQVIGQQNFQMGAVVSIVLLLPAIISFLIDRRLQRKQQNMIDDRAVPYQPQPNKLRDGLFLLFCVLVSLFIVLFIGMAVYASFIKFWPYNLSMSLDNYQFDVMDGGGWSAYYNSLKMAAMTAITGALFVFVTAYMVEKVDGNKLSKFLIQVLALLPMAIPGLVLGLAYIFFFNHPSNPFNFLYQTLTIMVISTIVHYYTVSHMTAVTALKQIDGAVESVSASLKVPQWVTFSRVTLPISLPAVLDISFYYFVNSLSTVSVVVFLYSTDTQLASVAVLNMDDAGDIAPAAAMATLIFVTALCARGLYALASAGLLKSTQRWRKR